MRYIIFVDGAVGVGKSTFIDILEDTFKSTLRIKNGTNAARSHRFNVDVLPEPLHRTWTQRIIDGVGGYDKLLRFLLVRKISAIESWSTRVASDGLQELEDNILIVERSLGGDRRVSGGNEKFMEELRVRYSGERVHNVLVLGRSPNFLENGEQMRLNLLYNEMEINGGSEAICRVGRPCYISQYFSEAAEIVKSVLGI